MASVITMRDSAGRQLLLWLREPGTVVLGRDLYEDRFVPMLVKGRHTATVERSIYFVQKRQGARTFCRDTAGQWTAFRDTFQFLDDGSFKLWYKCVHQTLLAFVRGESEELELFNELKRLGRLVELATVLETHDLR